MYVGSAAFVLIIVLAAIGAGLVKHYMRLQEARLQTQGTRQDSEYRSRIDTLERRVETLERIVTDQGYDLKREFEKL